MTGCICHKLLKYFAITVAELEFYTFQWFFVICIRFIDDDLTLGCIIFHCYCLDFGRIAYFESHIVRENESLWSLLFTESVLTDWQFFYVMRLIRGSPAFYDLIIFIEDRKFCTRDFHVAGDICFADFHLCHIVKHLVLLYFCCILNDKFNTFCSHIAIGRLCLCKSIGFTNHKLFDYMRFFCRNPLINHITIFVRDFQICAGNLFAGSKICFCDLYYGRFIFKSEVVDHDRFICITVFKGEFLLFFCSNKTIRSIDLLHIVFAIDWKICDELDLTIGIRCFQLNELICFDQHLAGCRHDICCSIKAKSSSFQDTFGIFFFFQDINRYSLAVILPVFVISYHRSILITVA